MPKFLEKVGVFDVFLLVVLFFSLWIRVNNFEYPLYNHETSRDYLVASHIANYGEIPILGPHNGGLDLAINSPVYYYFLSAFLLIWDDLLFLEAVNIALQMVAIAAVYFLGRVLFSAGAGFIAALLFASSYTILAESYSLWQPYIMLPFLNLAFLLLAVSQRTRRFWPAVAGGFLAVLAGALHISALGVLPVYWILQSLVFKSHKRSVVTLANAFLAQLIFLLLLYSPVVYHHLTNPVRGESLISKFEASPVSVFANFSNNLEVFFEAFFINQEYLFLPYLAVFAAAVVTYLLQRRYESISKLSLVLGVVTILWVAILTAFLKAPIFGYYFIPVFGFLMIIVAELIAKFSQRALSTFVIGIVVVVFLVKTFSFGFDFDRHKITTNAQYQIDTMTGAMVREIREIKSGDHRENLDFFLIFVLERGDLNPVDALFWVPLEEQLDTKLVSVSNSSNSYSAANSDDYMFLVCKLFLQDEQRDCIKAYIKRTSNAYELVDNIYNRYPFAIHFLKKI